MPFDKERTEQGGLSVTNQESIKKFPFAATGEDDISENDVVIDFENGEVRQKKPKDHSFFGDVETFTPANTSPGLGYHVQYYKFEDALLYHSSASPGKIVRVEGDSYSNITLLDPTEVPRTFVGFSALNKAFYGTDDGSVYPVDISGGSLSEGSEIVTGNSGGTSSLLSVPSIPVLIAVGESEVSLIDPDDESVLSTFSATLDYDLDTITGVSNYGYKSAPDRLLIGNATNDELLQIDLFNQNAVDLSSTISGDFTNVNYLPYDDSYIIASKLNGTIEKRDAHSLEVLEQTQLSDGFSSLTSGTFRTLEDRFILVTRAVSNSDEINTEVVDGSTLEVVDSLTFAGSESYNSVTYDSTRGKLFFVKDEADKYKTVDYKPYSDKVTLV